jgi:hypothetical protein
MEVQGDLRDPDAARRLIGPGATVVNFAYASDAGPPPRTGCMLDCTASIRMAGSGQARRSVLVSLAGGSSKSSTHQGTLVKSTVQRRR